MTKYRNGLPVDANGETRRDREFRKRREERAAKKSGLKVTIPTLTAESEHIRVLEAEVRRLQREAISVKAIREDIFHLAEADPNPPDWVLRPRQSAKKSPGVPILLASDWHLGEVVDTNQVNGVNEYNTAIAEARVRRLIEKTIWLLKEGLHGEYPGIVFALTGDMITGAIHEELAKTNDKEVLPTVLDLFNILIWCIDQLKMVFNKVFIPCVRGNHGRNTHKTQAKDIAYTSYEWLCYMLLEKHYENDKNVTVLVGAGADLRWDVFGHRYLQTHGDQGFSGGSGLAGFLVPMAHGDKKRRAMYGQISLDYDTLLAGHWHTLVQTRAFIVNGSLIGASEYSMVKAFGYERPQQALWITHPDHGITYQMPVVVDKAAASVKREWISWPTTGSSKI